MEIDQIDFVTPLEHCAVLLVLIARCILRLELHMKDPSLNLSNEVVHQESQKKVKLFAQQKLACNKKAKKETSAGRDALICHSALVCYYFCAKTNLSNSGPTPVLRCHIEIFTLKS